MTLSILSPRTVTEILTCARGPNREGLTWDPATRYMAAMDHLASRIAPADACRHCPTPRKSCAAAAWSPSRPRPFTAWAPMPPMARRWPASSPPRAGRVQSPDRACGRSGGSAPACRTFRSARQLAEAFWPGRADPGAAAPRGFASVGAGERRAGHGGAARCPPIPVASALLQEAGLPVAAPSRQRFRPGQRHHRRRMSPKVWAEAWISSWMAAAPPGHGIHCDRL